MSSLKVKEPFKFAPNFIKRDPDFEARYDLIMEKAAVVKKIIEYRIRHKLSQEQLAKEIGVTQQYISNRPYLYP